MELPPCFLVQILDKNKIKENNVRNTEIKHDELSRGSKSSKMFPESLERNTAKLSFGSDKLDQLIKSHHIRAPERD